MSPQRSLEKVIRDYEEILVASMLFRLTHYLVDLMHTSFKLGLGFCLVLLQLASNLSVLHAQSVDPATSLAVKFKFNHLTIDDGLSQNLVYSIFQDSKGFLWFGTKDGLNCYDGYRFKVFKHDPYDSTTLADNDLVYSIFEDHAGRIWVGTRSLNLFDRNTETVRRFVNDPDNPNSLIPGPIRAIAEDQDGALWLGSSGGGICRVSLRPVSQAGNNAIRVPNGEGYEQVIVEFSRFVHTPGDPASLHHNSVRDLIVDRHNRLWIAGNNWIDVLDPETVRKGAVVFRHHPLPLDRPTDVIAVYEDHNGTIWVGGSHELFKVVEKAGQPLRFESFPFAVSGGNNWTNDIAEDSDGRLWIATGTHLSIFDPKTEQHLPVHHYPNDPTTLSNPGVLAVLRDRSGNMWIGTAGNGIDIYIPRNNRMYHYQGNSEVFHSASISPRTLIETPDGHLWFVDTAGNVYELDQVTGAVTRHLKGSTATFFVRTMIRDRHGSFWLAANEGLVYYNPRTKRVVHYSFFAWQVLEGKDGSIWAATQSGVARYDRTTGIWRRYTFPRSANLPGGDVTRFAIYQDSAGVLWLGGDAGLIGFDPELKTVQRYLNDPHDPQSLSSDVIYSILPDPLRPNRYLWLGTKGGGLNRFDMQNKTFQHFTEKDGLSNNVVYGVLPDNQGNLWMSTNHGLCRIRLSSDSLAIANDPTGMGIVAVKNFDVSDGLQSNEFNYHSFCKGSSGRLYFGGINGITSFAPQQIRDNRYRPPVVITDFLLAYKRVDHRQPGAPLSQAISETKEITLSYKQNALSFEFAALDFTAPRKNQYAYKMEGVDDDWLYSGNEHRANYLNLSPGKYVFRVKGSNNDGVWNEAGTSIKITILPPWWQTWWAYTVYGLLFVAILYGIRRYELNRIRLKDQLKMKHFETDKLKELDQMRSRFFANISHEFRTPLTLILGQIENLRTEIGSPSQRKKLDMAIRHARRLRELINQLLDVAKLEAGKMPIRVQLANIVPFLKKLFASFESLAAKKKLGVRFYAERDRIEVYFEPEKLEKIFTNLVSNAIKFTPEGGEVSVRVRVPEIDSKAEWVEIEVRDSGIGIPEDRLPYIFNRFYQVASGNTRNYEGTGIGLALVKELVELHSGEIQVTSKVGMGTVFKVKLPLGRKHYSDEQITGVVKSISEPVTTSKSKPTLSAEGDRSASNQRIILIVEDNPDMRQYINENLQETYTIVEAIDGAQGFEMAKDLVPDLIISDVMMPNIDGYELARRIRSHELTSHIPIVMLTAKAAEEERLEGLETGVDAYLIKPFSIRELQVRVRKLIEMRQKLLEPRKQPLKITASEVAVTPVDEQFLERLQQVVEENMEDEGFQVGELCRKVGIGERQLYRKLKALLGCTPAAYIRQIRLDRAKQLLEKGAGTVSEVTFMVGYGNTSAFARAFRETFGQAPSKFLKK